MVKATIPIKENINIENGALLLSVSDIKEELNMHLITLGKIKLTIDYKMINKKINIVKKQKTIASVKVDEDNLDVIINWSNNNLWIHVYGKGSIPKYIGSSKILNVNNIFNNKLSLYEDNFFNGTYNLLQSFANAMEMENLTTFSLEAFKESTEVLFEADFTKPTHYKKDVVIEDTFAPIDGSPILLKDDKGLLRRQYFFDKQTNEYTNEIKEIFTFKGEKERSLIYKGIEKSYKPKIKFNNPEEDVFYVGDGKVELSKEKIIFNFTPEDIDILYGYEYKITYQLERSYNVEFNKNVPHDGLRINLVNMKAEEQNNQKYSSTENIRLIREGNRFEQEYLAREIELNPLVNPQVQGFMYISKKEQETNDFRINISSNYITANGVDTANVMIEAIDNEENEVLSPYLSTYIVNAKGDKIEGMGSIKPIIGYNSLKARNTSGRVYYQFKAPIIISEVQKTQKVFIVVVDRINGVSAQHPIYINTVNESQVFAESVKNKNYTNIPFEYFARYFERELDKTNPVHMFDYNKNGRIDREDLNTFIKEALDESSMNAITEELLKLEK